MSKESNVLGKWLYIRCLKRVVYLGCYVLPAGPGAVGGKPDLLPDTHGLSASSEAELTSGERHCQSLSAISTNGTMDGRRYTHFLRSPLLSFFFLSYCHFIPPGH